MEINITKFFNEARPRDYSASCAEIGQDAGRITWRAACDDSAEYMLIDTDEKRDTFHAHVRGFGAWSDDEINAWSDIELNALFIQLVSADIRESGLDAGIDWPEYYEQAEHGTVSGNLFRADDGQIYYLIGG